MHAAVEARWPAHSKYELLGLLGTGASGTVFRAVQHPVERIVAVKVLDEAQMRSESHRRRFRREAFALGRIDHPNVVTMYDYGEHAGQYHLVTEYVVGRSLDAVIRAEAPMEQGRALRLAIELLDALEAVHEAGFVHRDVKPANVMIYTDARGDEHVKLLDFGVAAALDRPGQLAEPVGTPRYMAPEQLQPGACCPRSDLFALGVIVYEMLTGLIGLPDRTVPALLSGTCDDRLAPIAAELEVDGDLEALIGALTGADAGARPESAASVRSTLQGILARTDPHRAVARRPLTGTVRPLADSEPAGLTETAGLEVLGVSPWARTMTHMGDAGLATPSGPWPVLEFVSGEVAEWSPYARGFGELPRLVATQAPSASFEVPRSSTVVEHPATSPGLSGGGTMARLTAPACTEAPCYRRRCFWAILALNAVGLGIVALF